MVYPSAVHTRFEHSIGTYHLAGLLTKHLQNIQAQEEAVPIAKAKDEAINVSETEAKAQEKAETKVKRERITAKDVLCVQVNKSY